ncbi:MAG: AsmA-like C-terminal domain-containing protein, partial [Phycisphaerae bacterium]|nr:AsmA-like C-terminal domain-containing protein [Phycisphaerae bacterium]
MFIFTLLVLVTGGYWYLTNDARVQQKVEQYLQRLTGAVVKVESAQFSLFGGIQVSNLQIRAVGSKIPFFEAPEVFITHRPSALMVRGTLEPTGIVCVGATIRPVLDLQTGKWNLPIINTSIWADGEKRKTPIVPIHMRNARLEVIEVLDGQQFRRPGVEMSVSLLPDLDAGMYNIILADKADAIHGQGTINIVTGQTLISGPVTEAWLDKTLPGKYLDWKKRHKLTFEKSWNVTVSLGGSGTATEPARRNQLIVDLKDVSMELPPAEGGLKFFGVRGRLVFDKDGVAMENLTGRITQAGGACFTLSGRYEGYQVNSPFKTSLTITDMTWPPSEDLAGVLGKTFAKFHKQIDPAGTLSVSAVLHRNQRGGLLINGWVDLKEVSLRLPYCPIRLDHVSGRIIITDNNLQLKDLRGRYGQAAVEISGQLTEPMDRLAYGIKVIVRNMPMTSELRDSLPEDLRSVWQIYSPRGHATFIVDARSGDKSTKPIRDITIEFDGKASLEYSGFPYRLEKVTGKVVSSANNVRIVSVRGSAGPMRCVLNGTITRKPGPDDFKITADITDLPLDEKVARALPKRLRQAYLSYGLKGRADIEKATVRRKNGGTVECDIPVVLKNASIRHSRFPCAIERVSGAVRITHKKVTVQHLVGWRGHANVNITGSVSLRHSGQDVNLTIEAAGLSLDAALREALPKDTKRGWDLLTPSGTANVTLRLIDSPPAAAAKSTTQPAWTYRLIVKPQNMRIKYRHFPYPLRLTGGTAIIEPDTIVLDSFSGLAGGAKVVLDGRISTAAGNERADLSVQTGAVKVDRNLLSALPDEMVQALQLRPGGTVRLAIKKLEIRREITPKKQPASSPSREKPKHEPLAWRWAGKVAFADAVTNLGMGAKRMTGWVEGEMSCKGPPEKLVADAKIFLESFVVGPRRLESITAHLHKTVKSSVLRIDKISGQVFGGRVAGFAEVRLTKPAKYGISLSVENIDLAKFIGPEAKAPKQRRDVRGLLTGNIQLTATVGDLASRRASGKLQISKAKLYRLPVLLGFLHVVNLTLPTGSAFHTGEINYYLEGNTLVLREIHLQGSALSMLGAGKMDMKSKKLSLTFLTGPPRKLPRLAALSEVLEGLASQLMTVRVTGTLDKPKVKTVPFRSLDATMHELFEP